MSRHKLKVNISNNYSIAYNTALDQTSTDFDWKHLLLGRDGLLTSIFNEFKERHKADLGKVKPNVPQADLTPGSAIKCLLILHVFRTKRLCKNI